MRKWEIVRPESGEESGMDANFMLAARPSQRTAASTLAAQSAVANRTLPQVNASNASVVSQSQTNLAALVRARFQACRECPQGTTALAAEASGVVVVIPTTTRRGSEEESAFPARCCAPASRRSRSSSLLLDEMDRLHRSHQIVSARGIGTGNDKHQEVALLDGHNCRVAYDYASHPCAHIQSPKGPAAHL